MGKVDYIGKVQTTLGALFGAQRQTYTADLTNKYKKHSQGKIVIRIDSVYYCNDEMRAKVSAKLPPFKFLCCDGDNNPYFTISKAREHEGKVQDYVIVYRSDQLQDTTSPCWPVIKERLGKICNGNRNHQIRF